MLFNFCLFHSDILGLPAKTFNFHPFGGGHGLRLFLWLDSGKFRLYPYFGSLTRD